MFEARAFWPGRMTKSDSYIECFRGFFGSPCWNTASSSCAFSRSCLCDLSPSGPWKAVGIQGDTLTTWGCPLGQDWKWLWGRRDRPQDKAHRVVKRVWAGHQASYREFPCVRQSVLALYILVTHIMSKATEQGGLAHNNQSLWGGVKPQSLVPLKLPGTNSPQGTLGAPLTRMDMRERPPFLLGRWLRHCSCPLPIPFPLASSPSALLFPQDS